MMNDNLHMSYCTEKKINKFNSRKTDERMNKNIRRDEDEGCTKLALNKDKILESFYLQLSSINKYIII